MLCCIVFRKNATHCENKGYYHADDSIIVAWGMKIRKKTYLLETFAEMSAFSYGVTLHFLFHANNICYITISLVINVFH